MINSRPINTSYKNQPQISYQKSANPVFKGKPNISPYAVIESVFEKSNNFGTFFLTKFFEAINRSKIAKLFNEINGVDKKSPDYIEKVINVCRAVVKDEQPAINLESKRFSEIADSKESCIFMMNHDRASSDARKFAVSVIALYSEYLQRGRAQDCPRPVILVSDNLLKPMGKKLRAIFESAGIIGIDATIFSHGGANNAGKLMRALHDFKENKVNFYIFPEGKREILRGVDPKIRFQQGLAKMIQKLLQKKKEIKVVPLGFAYGKKPGESSIYIGDHVLFKRDQDRALFTRGNIDSEDLSGDNETFSTITEADTPIEGEALTKKITEILFENSRICREKAYELLQNYAMETPVQL